MRVDVDVTKTVSTPVVAVFSSQEHALETRLRTDESRSPVEAALAALISDDAVSVA